MTQPRLKKSETLEIRLPYPTKLAFMARCRDEGRSASEALRGFIDGQVEPAQIEAKGPAARATPRLIVAALIAAALGAVAVPSLAHPSLRGTTAEFARLDTNHDGKISFEEFRAAYGSAPRR
jgi:hypothetical protein